MGSCPERALSLEGLGAIADGMRVGFNLIYDVLQGSSSYVAAF